LIRASDLTGCVVRTESGEKVGRVHDLRLQEGRGETWHLHGIVVGRSGMFKRLGIRGARDSAPLIGGGLVAWEAITRIEEGVITIRDGSSARQPSRVPAAPSSP
jgi:sporulation protein YlmC with PRC-barrel domain